MRRRAYRSGQHKARAAEHTHDAADHNRRCAHSKAPEPHQFSADRHIHFGVLHTLLHCNAHSACGLQRRVTGQSGHHSGRRERVVRGRRSAALMSGGGGSGRGRRLRAVERCGVVRHCIHAQTALQRIQQHTTAQAIAHSRQFANAANQRGRKNERQSGERKDRTRFAERRERRRSAVH